MNLWQRANAYHRFWRYRLRTERNEIALMLRLNLAGGTLIDAGANRGAYSYWLHKCAGSDGCVLAFEPQPELVEYLGELKHDFRLNRLTVVGSALSEAPGKLALVRPRAHWGAASFHLDEDQLDCDVLSVPVTTLDSYLGDRQLPPVRFIKCDVQDHELFVFRGAKRVLQTYRPTLLFEQTEECVKTGAAHALLAELGYRGFFFFRGKLVEVDRLRELRSKIAAPHLNYVYRPSEDAGLRLAA
jgi:FkbM family methyltransferase